MKTLLRVTALLLSVWVLALWPFRSSLLAETDGSLLTTILADIWAITNLVCAALFWRASRAVRTPSAAVYGSMLMAAVKTAGDLYGMLSLPPSLALVCVGDLVLSVAQFVGFLRELPRFLEGSS